MVCSPDSAFLQEDREQLTKVPDPKKEMEEKGKTSSHSSA